MGTGTSGPDPRAYPYALERDGDRVSLVVAGAEEKRLDLGGGPNVRAAYVRWRHLLDDHGRADANLFMWGFVTGLAAGADRTIAEIEGMRTARAGKS